MLGENTWDFSAPKMRSKCTKLCQTLVAWFCQGIVQVVLCLPAFQGSSNPGKKNDKARWQGWDIRLVLRHPAQRMGGRACGRIVFKRGVVFHSFCAILCVHFLSEGPGASAQCSRVLWEASMKMSSLKHGGCVWMTHCSSQWGSFSLFSCGIEYPSTELNQHLENILSLSTLIFQSCFSLHA